MITKEFLISNLASAALHGALLVGAGATAQYSVASAPTAMEISLAGSDRTAYCVLRTANNEQRTTNNHFGFYSQDGIKIKGSDVTSLRIGTPSQTHGACPQINPPPLYPRAARRQGIEGKVVLSVAINAAGKVDAVTVDASSGHPILDEAARSGVSRWIFAPARRLGVPISSQMEIPIIFQLKD